MEPQEDADFQYSIMDIAVSSLVEFGRPRPQALSTYSEWELVTLLVNMLDYQGNFREYRGNPEEPFEYLGTVSTDRRFCRFKKDSTIKRFHDMFGVALTESQIKQQSSGIKFEQDKITFTLSDGGEGWYMVRPMTPRLYEVYNDGSCDITWNYKFEDEWTGDTKTGAVSATFTKNPDSFFGYTLKGYEIHSLE